MKLPLHAQREMVRLEKRATKLLARIRNFRGAQTPEGRAIIVEADAQLHVCWREQAALQRVYGTD